MRKLIFGLAMGCTLTAAALGAAGAQSTQAGEMAAHGPAERSTSLTVTAKWPDDELHRGGPGGDAAAHRDRP